MNKIYELREDEPRDVIYRRILLLMGKNRETWPAVGAAVGLFGGLLSIVLGVLVWAAAAFIGPAGSPGSFLDVAGTVLFVMPFPLLALGAHGLDLLEKKGDAQKNDGRPGVSPHGRGLIPSREYDSRRGDGWAVKVGV